LATQYSHLHDKWCEAEANSEPKKIEGYPSDDALHSWSGVTDMIVRPYRSESEDDGYGWRCAHIT
jgi:hypothetical protein